MNNDNLPVPIRPATPLPARRIAPAPPLPLAPATAPRDVAAAIRTAQDLLNATARYAAELQHILPQPQLCAACHIDVAFYTDVQRAQHWEDHGALVRFMTRLRGLRGM